MKLNHPKKKKLYAINITVRNRLCGIVVKMHSITKSVYKRQSQEKTESPVVNIIRSIKT